MQDLADITFEDAFVEQSLRVTPAAGVKIAELMADVDDEMEGVRVFVTGGGCSGMTYGMTYADAISAYDSTLEGDGYRLVVDAIALNFLKGSEIDFDEDRFMFRNVFQSVGGSGMCGGCGGSGY